MLSQFIGSVLIVSGTAIGAGMLAMPLTAGFSDYPTNFFVLFGFWAVMYYTTLVNLEANLRIGKGVSISEITRIVFGKYASYIVMFSLGTMLYAVISAYIAGESSLIKAALPEDFPLSQSMIGILFTALFAFVISLGIHKMDHVNRIFLFLKGVLLLGMIALLSGHIQGDNLMASSSYSWPQWSTMLSVFFTSFGFQVCIPYLVNYCHQDVKILRRVILVGTLIPFFIYALWLFVSKGVLPLEGPLSFTALQDQGNSVGLFIEMLSAKCGNPQVEFVNMGYSLLAMTTSFLGVGMALYCLISEKLAPYKQDSKILTVLLCFLPPLAVIHFHPDAFVKALQYAAAFLSIFALLAPAAVVWKLRSQQTETPYQAPGGRGGLILMGLVGVGFLWLGL